MQIFFKIMEKSILILFLPNTECPLTRPRNTGHSSIIQYTPNRIDTVEKKLSLLLIYALLNNMPLGGCSTVIVISRVHPPLHS